MNQFYISEKITVVPNFLVTLYISLESSVVQASEATKREIQAIDSFQQLLASTLLPLT
jgi:hypothetical protein